MALDYSRNTVQNNASRWAAVNDELEKIQIALQDGLSRSGDSPNAMSAGLDMGGHDVLNAGTVSVDVLLIDGSQVPSLEDLAEAYASYLAVFQQIETAVENARDAAVAAQLASEAAQSLSESARDSAIAAETGAQGHETAAQSYASDAEDSAAAAAASAAGVDLPPITAADEGDTLVVNSSGVWELTSSVATPVLWANGATGNPDVPSSSSYAAKGIPIIVDYDTTVYSVSAMVGPYSGGSDQYYATILELDSLASGEVQAVVATSPNYTAVSSDEEVIRCVLDTPVILTAGTLYAILLNRDADFGSTTEVCPILISENREWELNLPCTIPVTYVRFATENPTVGDILDVGPVTSNFFCAYIGGTFSIT